MSHCPFFCYPIPHAASTLTLHFIYLHSYWRFFFFWLYFHFSTIVNHYKGQRIYQEGEVMTCIYAYWDWLSAVGFLVLILRRLWNIFTSLWSNFPDLHLENVKRRRKKKIFFHFLLLGLVIKVDSVAALNIYIYKGRKSHERVKSILDCVWRECFHRSFIFFSIFFESTKNYFFIHS